MVEMFKYMHKFVEKLSVQYKEEVRRYNYVTPKSYLELLSLFVAIMKEKRKE